MNVMELSTRDLLKEFVTLSRHRYGDYGHAAGFLESHCAKAIDLLPTYYREPFMQSLREKVYEYMRENEAAETRG